MKNPTSLRGEDALSLITTKIDLAWNGYDIFDSRNRSTILNNDIEKLQMDHHALLVINLHQLCLLP